MIYTVTLNPSIDYVVQLADMQIGHVNRLQQDFKFPGGKGINVSRILKAIDVPATALGFVGGFTGEYINHQLQQMAITTDFTTVFDDTRINVKIKATQETELNAQGPKIAASEIQTFKNKLKQLLQPGDIVILAGSLPSSLPTTFYDELITIIQEQKSEFVIDTASDALLSAVAKKPLLVKPNNHELAAVFNTTLENREAIITYGQKLLKMGAQHVLVSMAGDGALLITEKQVYFAPAILGEVKNSVGAGDSMIAGFTGKLHTTNSVLTAFKWGVACGSATAFSDDLATTEYILELFEQVKIEVL